MRYAKNELSFLANYGITQLYQRNIRGHGYDFPAPASLFPQFSPHFQTSSIAELPARPVSWRARSQSQFPHQQNRSHSQQNRDSESRQLGCPLILDGQFLRTLTFYQTR